MGYSHESLPSGLQLLGRPWSDPILIELAYAYEQATRHRVMPTTVPILRVNAPKGRFPPIRVKLVPHRVADVRSSSSSGMGEAAIHVGIGVQQSVKRERADDRANQPSQGCMLHAPERREVGLVKQVLRGKSPGIPG